jgi:hypothetical protein
LARIKGKMRSRTVLSAFDPSKLRASVNSENEPPESDRAKLMNTETEIFKPGTRTSASFGNTEPVSTPAEPPATVSVDVPAPAIPAAFGGIDESEESGLIEETPDPSLTAAATATDPTLA